ncbi:arginine deiminase family protein [Mesorhizobium sp. ORM6]
MGERTTPQAVGDVARSLFATGEATRVIAALMPRDRSFMHLDTVFTFCDRDLATMYPPVVERLRTFSIRPGDGDAAVEVRRRKRPSRQSWRRLSGCAMSEQLNFRGRISQLARWGKISAAIEFVQATDNPSAIGRLEDAVEIVKGRQGTWFEA